MIASGAVPALLPAHIGVSQTSQFTNQSELCQHPEAPPDLLRLQGQRRAEGALLKL
jgi:hypothetical protein